MAASLVLRLSRRLQPPCAALLVLATAQLCAPHATAVSCTAVRGALAAGLQMAPERS